MSADMHRTVQELAGRADMLLQAGQLEQARQLCQAAAEIEEKVWESTPDERPRTKGIVGLSAVVLFRRGGNSARALGIALRTLTNPETPDFVKDQLFELVPELRQETRSQRPTAALAEQSLAISLEGPDVAAGTIPMDLLQLRLDQVKRLATRVWDWVTGEPFRPTTRREVPEPYALVVTQPQFGSFRLGIRVNLPYSQLPMLEAGAPVRRTEADPNVPKRVAWTLVRVIDDVANLGEQELARSVSDEGYREVFRQHVANLAPDGRRLRLIRFDHVSGTTVVTATLTPDIGSSIRSEMRRLRQRLQRPGDKEQEITDVLRGVQLNKGWIVLGTKEEEQTLFVDKERAAKVFEDVIGPMINHRVQVLARKPPRGRNLLFYDVSLAADDGLGAVGTSEPA